MQAFPAASVHLLDLVWLALDLVFLLGLVLHIFSRFRKIVWFQDAIRYGKTKTVLQRPAWFHWFDLPKRWFCHFYVLSVTWNSILLWILLRTLLWGIDVPEWINSLYHYLGIGSQQTVGAELSTILAIVLLWVHSFRRLMECLYVSVFSKGMIHLAHYCLGIIYYVLVGITLFSHSRLDNRALSVGDVLMQARWYHAIGLMLYIWASGHQHKTHIILANLRKSKSGEIVSMNHVVPHGDWFEYVSCPHYFAELLIYVSIAILFGLVYITWWFVILFVLFNQALAALLCHEFYHDKFKSYPSNRKAFIPFLF
ncbi:polyprenal reductase [Pelodytes ibericus]